MEPDGAVPELISGRAKSSVRKMPRHNGFAIGLLIAYIGLLFAPNLVFIYRDPTLVPIVRGLIVSGLLVATVFSLFRRHLWIACALLSPFAVFAPAEAYYIARYGHPSDANIVATVLETNLREASAFLGPARFLLCASFTCTALLAVATTVQVRGRRLTWRHPSANWVAWVTLGVPLLSLLIAAFQVSAGSLGERLTSTLQRLSFESYATYPFGVVGRFIAYRREWSAMREAAGALADFKFGAQPKQKIADRQIYILVVGEASRRDRWSLFGYPRITNPELANTDGLVPVGNMISPWGASRWAVPVIVTRKPPEDWNPSFKEPSISRVFQEAGFRTFWYSTQSAVGMFDSPISVAAFDAQSVRFFNPAGFADSSVHDDALLEPLRTAIDSSSENLFIVLHTMGSHQDYGARYPSGYDRFTPSTQSGSGSDFEQLSNSYDNSVLFTDHFLKSVIDTLAGSPTIAALFYVADHGEMLPDVSCSAIGHGFSGLPVYTVPALFWHSPDYASRFPDKIAAIKSHSQEPLSTTNVFESLVDMANLDFPGHDLRNSIFSAHWTFERRLVHADTTVDFDHKVVLPKCQVVVNDPSGRNG